MVLSLQDALKSVGQSSPEFEAPPVVETAIGFRFAPIELFNIIHFGQLFEAYKEHYPHAQIQPAIGSSQIQFRTAEEGLNPAYRCWYISSDNTQLVQLQNDLFVRNWRATTEHPEYRHYESIRPLFSRDWVVFLSFLDTHGVKRPDVWQCEVSYINQLVRGREWTSFEDLPALFPIWAGLENGKVFSGMEMAAFTVTIKLPDDTGRIQFSLQPGVRKDGSEILQLTVSALGQPAAQENQSLFDWLDFGHLAVVNGFAQFTSEHAHKIWGKK